MVQNKEQLIAMATEWVDHAMTDLRQQISNFIEAEGTNVETIADVLDLDVNELNALLDGTLGDIAISSLARILIATDNVLEVKPVGAMPPMGMPMGAMPQRGGHRPPMGGGMPPMGGQMPQRGGHRPPMGYPHPHEMPMGAMPPMGMPMGGQMPQRGGHRPPMGGGMPPMGGQMPQRFGGMPGIRRNTPTPQPMNSTSSLDELSRNQLIDIINNNGWSGEIDAISSTRGELIDFLEMKNMPTPTPSVQRVETRPVNEEATAEHAQQSADASKARMAQMIAEALAENPQLCETISKYMQN